MKKKIIIATMTGIALVTILMTGCGKKSPGPVPPATINPPATSSIPAPTSPLLTPPAPISSPAAPIYSPTVAPGTSDTNSDALQNGIPLKITDPADAAEINTDTTTVKGQTVPGATVSVNDTIGTADSSGNFNVTVSLDQGPNAIDVIATDDSGKQGEALILVNVVSSRPPAAAVPQAQSEETPGSVPLEVTQPVDAATLNTDTVAVKGQTAPGATVIINDQIDTADSNGNFNVTVSLVSGANAIDVIAQEDNGDENEVIIMVNEVS